MKDKLFLWNRKRNTAYITGILNCSPFDPKGFIQWEAVEDIQVWKSTRNGSALELVMKEKNALGKIKTSM